MPPQGSNHDARMVDAAVLAAQARVRHEPGVSRASAGGRCRCEVPDARARCEPGRASSRRGSATHDLGGLAHRTRLTFANTARRRHGRARRPLGGLISGSTVARHRYHRAWHPGARGTAPIALRRQRRARMDETRARTGSSRTPTPPTLCARIGTQSAFDRRRPVRRRGRRREHRRSWTDLCAARSARHAPRTVSSSDRARPVDDGPPARIPSTTGPLTVPSGRNARRYGQRGSTRSRMSRTTAKSRARSGIKQARRVL